MIGRQTPAWLIEEYIKLRNKVNEIKAKHVEQLEPFATVMATIESQLLDHLQKNELGSVKGDTGTAYKQTVTSVTVDNWDRALGWIQLGFARTAGLKTGRNHDHRGISEAYTGGENFTGFGCTSPLVVTCRFTLARYRTLSLGFAPCNYNYYIWE
jgi:hypothetical protein